MDLTSPNKKCYIACINKITFIKTMTYPTPNQFSNLDCRKWHIEGAPLFVGMVQST